MALARHRREPPGNRDSRFWGLPRSSRGWWAAILGLLFAGFALAMPLLLSAIKDSTEGRLGGGREMVALTVALGLAVSAIGLRAIVRNGERSVLVWLAVMPAALMTLFWVLFAAGEVLIGHD